MQVHMTIEQVYMSKEHMLIVMEGKAPLCGTPKIRGLGGGDNLVQPHILKNAPHL
jgi:hypothetical protein